MSSPAPRDVLEIVSDLRGSADAQVRRNVVTALATIGTWECASPLVDLATMDSDQSVRRRAFDGLAELDADAKWHASRRASDLLHELSEADESADEKTGAKLEVGGRANDILTALGEEGDQVVFAERHFARRFALFWRVRHYLLRQRPPRPLWRPFLLGLLGALPGAALTAFLFSRWDPFLSGHVILGILLPAALLASVLTTASSHHRVPVERYCDPHMGALVEIAGLVWRPFWVPISICAVVTLALVTLGTGFPDLELKAFRILSWLVLSFLGLVIILTAMRAATVAVPPRLGRLTSALAGGLTALVIGPIVLLGFFRIWPRPGVAILVSEATLLLLPLVTAYVFEHFLSPIAAARGPAPSRMLVSTLIALLIVLLPGAWIHFNPLQPLTLSRGAPMEEWRWAHVPVHRKFRVDSVQTVRARLESQEARAPQDLELRLTRQERKIESDREVDGWRWWDDLPPGDYRLGVTIRDRDLEKGPLSFVVRDGYASAVGLMARHLLESLGEDVPASLVAPFKLVLSSDQEEDEGENLGGGGPKPPPEG